MNPLVQKPLWFAACAAVALFLAAFLDAKPWSHKDWRTADRSSAGISPLPQDEPEALVQGFAARAFRWRGIFSVHTWIALKEKNAPHYNVYHVTGWRLKRTQSAVAVETDLPDRNWYGRKPSLLFEVKGEKAEKVIPLIYKAVETYPSSKRYRAWPGPNSNTFISHILRSVPEIGVELPPNAIGKDWINEGDLFGASETGTGFQVSLFGLLGLTAGVGDGLELNLLGLCFGFDILRPALKLPLVGRLGMTDKRVSE